jgi:hypothetical protein
MLIYEEQKLAIFQWNVSKATLFPPPPEKRRILQRKSLDQSSTAKKLTIFETIFTPAFSFIFFN